MGSMIPDRIRWAVETLAVDTSDQLLEIGGGSGVAASLICPLLHTGRLHLIDRSTAAIERTRRRNEEHIATGRLTLETVELAEFDAGNAHFDKIFAVNVNIFWTTPATRELAQVRKAIAPSGRLFLFYETPSAGRARQVAERVAKVLRATGYVEPENLAPAANLVCCISHPI